MLSKRNINHYAQARQIDAMVAERDVILTYVLKVLSEESKEKPLLHSLAFKGGTCLKKIYFGKSSRFSMDLDFTSLSLNPEDFKRRLHSLLHKKQYYGITFQIDEEFSRDEKLSYGAHIAYSHEWNKSTFEIEVSFREKPTLEVEFLPLHEELYFRYCEFNPFEVPCLQKEELIAEKIRAAFQRLSSRDLFDLYLCSKTSYNKKWVRALAVIKCWNARDPFDPNRFFKKIGAQKYNWSDLKRLVRQRQLPSEKEMIKTIMSNYSYLKKLDDPLKKIIADSKPQKHVSLVKSLILGLKTP